jgi:ABC-type glycerol-3-phosphate transport system substrate-binding protein
LRSRFEAGQSAYYVGSSSELDALIESLGEENLGVAEPPDGPGGNAMPLLSSQGFFLSQAGSDTQVALALEFIQFATNSENQMYLAEAGGFIPVNAAIDLSEGTYMDTLISVARNAIAKPNSIHMQTVLARGDTYYERVLEGGEVPESVVVELTTAINDEHGIAPLPTPEPTQPPAPEPVEEEDNGSLMLEGEDPGADIEATPEGDSENASNE